MSCVVLCLSQSTEEKLCPDIRMGDLSDAAHNLSFKLGFPTNTSSISCQRELSSAPYQTCFSLTPRKAAAPSTPLSPLPSLFTSIQLAPSANATSQGSSSQTFQCHGSLPIQHSTAFFSNHNIHLGLAPNWSLHPLFPLNTMFFN